MLLRFVQIDMMFNPINFFMKIHCFINFNTKQKMNVLLEKSPRVKLFHGMIFDEIEYDDGVNLCD